MSSPSSDPAALLRSRRYVGLLILAAILGVPISAAAYGFLALVSGLQEWLFTDLPGALGFDGTPLWWPLPLLALAGVLVGLTIRYLPGRGGHSPADGFEAGGVPSPIELPGIAIAALATLSLGAVLGPEAPLIALGAGLAGSAVRLARRDVPAQATAVVAAAGSFAAISTLLGSPLLGAFLLMEASGLGGPTLGLVLVPGLVAAGVGSLIFIGLDAWTGLGTYSLALPDVPPFAQPDLAQFGWALVIGLVAAVVGTGIRRLALALRPHVERRLLLATPLVGVAVGTLAIVYAQASGHNFSEVLFSGQNALGPLISNSASYSVGALVLLVACKGLAYGAGRLPGRTGVSGDVPWRGGWDRAVPSARAAAGPRGGHGHRGDVGGAAQAAVDLGPAGHLVAGRGRAGSDAAGDRGRGGGLCGLGQTHPASHGDPSSPEDGDSR
jgi:H+/Cl- antiporter ClcA